MGGPKARPLVYPWHCMNGTSGWSPGNLGAFRGRFAGQRLNLQARTAGKLFLAALERQVTVYTVFHVVTDGAGEFENPAEASDGDRQDVKPRPFSGLRFHRNLFFLNVQCRLP